jgi:hypothetical protein
MSGGDVSTKMAEGFFSQLKRSIDGAPTTASPPSTYTAAWPSSTFGTARKVDDSERMRRVVSQVMGHRLAHCRIIG